MRVGILGTGHMGNTHARQFRKMPDVRIGYHDRHPDRADNFGNLWGAERCGSSDELIEWADVVDICLPTDLHKSYALRAIEAGKAVFLEKPLATSLEDAQAIVDAARAAGTPLMVGQVLRYFPEYRQAHRMVKSGAVGRPAAIRMRRGGYTPGGYNGWFLDHTRSGGVLLDLAIHDFDWLRWTLGDVRLVYARSVAAESNEGPDYGLATLTFECGTVAHVEATWMDPSGFRTTLEVAGSEGMIQYDSRETPALRTNRPTGARLESTLLPHDDPYYRELHDFLSAVREQAPSPIPGEEGLEALRISLAAMESAKTGRVVELR